MSKFKFKKFLQYFLKSFGILLGFLFIVILISNSIQIFNIVVNAKEINSSLTKVKHSIESKNIDDFFKYSTAINKDSKELRNNLNDIKFFQILPIVGDNLNSLNNLTEISILSTDSVLQLEPLIRENYSILFSKDMEDMKVISIPKDAKKKILLSIEKNKLIFDKIEKNLEEIITKIDYNKEDDKVLFKQILNIWNKIYENENNIKTVHSLIPIIKISPDLLGVNKEAKYLLLFQNNTELRPTGGFIGTYGLAYVSNGDVRDIFTDNIYNLDFSSIGRVKLQAPEPMKKYLNLDYLFLRDANWNPDYYESASYIEKLYKKESLNNYPITGVIAITPDLLKDVIGFFGEIKVEDLVLDKENAVDLLNYETKFAYWKKDLSRSQRKVIIQKLADILFEKVKTLSLDDLERLWNVIEENLSEKHLLLFSSNNDIQKFIQINNWDGSVKDQKNSDYLQVVDSNFLSGKIDPYIKRDIDYSITLKGKELVASLSLTYNYEYEKNKIYNDEDQYTTYYKSYTRVYVPKGSWLSLLKRDENLINRQDISFGIENEKAFFGFYVSIPRNQSATYTLEYRLPLEITEALLEKYTLNFQKQSGLPGHNINITINLNKPIKNYTLNTNSDLKVNLYDNTFNLNGYSKLDRSLTIDFYNKIDISALRGALKMKYLSFGLEEKNKRQ